MRVERLTVFFFEENGRVVGAEVVVDRGLGGGRRTLATLHDPVSRDALLAIIEKELS